MPIIFITGYGDVPMTVRAMKAGAVEFLTKPFSDDVLLSAILNAIERSRTALSHEAEILALRRCHASPALTSAACSSERERAYVIGTAPRRISGPGQHLIDVGTFIGQLLDNQDSGGSGSVANPTYSGVKPFPQAAARLSINVRSRSFCVSEAARSISARASAKRPSLARKSPRTLGRRW